MSGEAKRMVIDIFERWNGGEREFDAALFSPSVEVRSAMTNTTFSGEEGLRRWVAEIDDLFSVWRLDVDTYDEPVEGTVIASGHVRGEGLGSGVPFEQPMSWIVEIAESRVTALHTFLGKDGAAEYLRRSGR